jgi:amphi-Trp domain-containing protein
MAQRKNSFRHDSLHDAETIRDLLEALTDGLGRGRLTFRDDEGEIVMHPEGLLRLKLRASRDDNRNRVDVRISWQTAEPAVVKKPLTVE